MEGVGPEVTSSAQSTEYSLDGFPVGSYEFEVRTFDGEFWSPWSTATPATTVRIEPTIAAPSVVGSGATPTPSLDATVSAPPATGYARPTLPGGGGGDFSTQEVKTEPAPELSYGTVLTNIPPAIGSADIVEVEPVWTWMPEVESTDPFEVMDTDGWPAAVYEFEVRTHDGEFWSEWSSDSATFTIPAIISAPSAAGSADSVAPSLIPSVSDVPSAEGSGSAAAPIFTVEVNLTDMVPSAVGSADIVEVEPVWTWMREVESTDESHVLDTDGWPVSVYEFEVRTHDGEFWSPWSSDSAVVTIPAIISAPTATGSGDSIEPSLAPSVTAPVPSGVADAVPPIFTVEVNLTDMVQAATATAQMSLIAPIWTWLAETPSTVASGELLTAGMWEGQYEVEVRTFDGEFWSEWSSDTATFKTVDLSNVYLFRNGAWQKAPRYIFHGGTWTESRSELVGTPSP